MQIPPQTANHEASLPPTYQFSRLPLQQNETALIDKSLRLSGISLMLASNHFQHSKMAAEGLISGGI
jgi:hypothetical protein